jgi:hypothetical protein
MTDDEYEELIEYLEHDQLVTDRSRPLPPARLGNVASFSLWVLRVFVIVVSAMVIYTFIAQL